MSGRLQDEGAGPSEEVYFSAFFPPLRAEPLPALPPSWPWDEGYKDP